MHWGYCTIAVGKMAGLTHEVKNDRKGVWKCQKKMCSLYNFFDMYDFQDAQQDLFKILFWSIFRLVLKAFSLFTKK